MARTKNEQIKNETVVIEQDAKETTEKQETQNTQKSEVENNESDQTTDSPKKRVYAADDMIPCKSVTAGELLYSAKKSGIFYRWADYGSVEDVRYEDLVYLRDSKSMYLYSPLFIIEDDELVNDKKWARVKEVYNSLMESVDIDEILSLPINDFKAVLKQMPKNIQNTIKIVITEKLENGTFDSIKKVKAVDEILNSDLLCLIK